MLNDLAFSNLFFIGALVIAYVLFGLFLLSSYRKSKRGSDWLASYQGKDHENKVAWWKVVIKSLVSIFSSSDEEMRLKFLAAGFYNTKYAAYFMPLKYTLLFLGGAGIYFWGVKSGWEVSSTISIICLWLVCTLIAPDSYLVMRTKALRIRVSNKLPYLIDLLAVCVQTGMTIEAAMSYLTKELSSFDKDLGFILTKTNDRTKIVGLNQALDELYVRVNSHEMRSFVMTLKQSLQYGSSIYNVLTTLSADIREVQMLGVEERIGKLSAKMSVPLILFIMIPILILVAAPGVMRAMNV
ncbi:type II secretion system F family protein [Marinomonas sp. 2405UD66-6]|uniref:type II secretion system F family protein n=1 Tax=Marinomonas sp. 2405UD66-6 TaxID=3391834 RepID=UPI0039C91D51